MKAIEQYCSVVLFNMLCKVVLPFVTVEKGHLIIQVKAIDQYFSMVLFITLYKTILTFDSMDEILKPVHSNEIN